MRVVVAGSSGLIGTNLVTVLRQGGHEVIRLVRRDPRAPDERSWNPDSGELDSAVLDGADAVVNLCGAGVADRRWTPARKQLLTSSRIRPTNLLAETVAARGVPVLVNASGVNYYGDTGSRIVTESAAPGSGFLAELCQEWEAATSPAEGARVVRLRTGPVLSPAGGLVGQLRPLFAFLLGGRLGDGTQYIPWISLDDALEAIRFVLENPRVAGPVNLTGPAPVTNAEFTKALGEALGRPVPWVVPGFAMRMVAGELADEAALSGQRALPGVLEEHGFTFLHPTVQAALAAAVAG